MPANKQSIFEDDYPENIVQYYRCTCIFRHYAHLYRDSCVLGYVEMYFGFFESGPCCIMI